MKTKVPTLNHHHHLLLPVNINISPWMINNPKLTRSSTTRPSRRSLKLKAESKGFGGSETRKKPNKNNNKMFEMKLDDVDKDDKIPDVVFERIIGRILLYVGAPLGTGLALLVFFQVLKDQQLWDVPIWVPALTTFITFGASTLGVAYGALSTSWDPNDKGSILGFQEATRNWDDMWLDEEE